jgi:hypothetical protein
MSQVSRYAAWIIAGSFKGGHIDHRDGQGLARSRPELDDAGAIVLGTVDGYVLLGYDIYVASRC